MHSGAPTAVSAAIGGVVASATGQFAAYPFDTLRRRMQVTHFVSDPQSGTRMRHILMDVLREEGARGLYRGWAVNFAKVNVQQISGVDSHLSSADMA